MWVAKWLNNMLVDTSPASELVTHHDTVFRSPPPLPPWETRPASIALQICLSSMLVWNSLRMPHTANKDPSHHHVGVLSPGDYCCLQWDGNTCWSHISLKLPSCGCNMLPLGLANTITLQQWPCLTHNWHVAVITAHYLTWFQRPVNW